MKLRQKITAAFLCAALLLATACGAAPAQSLPQESSAPTIRFLLRGTAAGGLACGGLCLPRGGRRLQRRADL